MLYGKVFYLRSCLQIQYDYVMVYFQKNLSAELWCCRYVVLHLDDLLLGGTGCFPWDQPYSVDVKLVLLGLHNFTI